jgi:UDP-N-acetylglucosamine 2-epimerase
MRLANVVGTRPQLIKAAALQPALAARHEEVFIDTGQHWDESMAGAFFRELGLRAPDRTLGIGGGTAGEQTGRMLVALEGALRDVAPEAVVVYGDTNSTLAATLVAAKMDLPVAHVEAGLRSFDRRMPEEVNRIVTDHLARWRFAPTDGAVANLAAEGLRDGVHRVGDVMRDLAARTLPEVRAESALAALGGEAVGGGGLRTGEFLFATVHRAENRAPDAIRGWVGVLEAVARADRPVVLALHPGTRQAMDDLGVRPSSNVLIVEPLGYRSSLAAQLHAAAVLTDSGGVQREAAWLGTPCLVLRGSTEWLETTEGDEATSVLVGLDAARAREALDRLAPPDRAPAEAERRARERTIETDGATESIARLLA